MDKDPNELEIIVNAWTDDEINPDKSYSKLCVLNIDTGIAKGNFRTDKLFRKHEMGAMVALGDVIYILGNPQGPEDDDYNGEDVDVDEDETKDKVREEKDDDPSKAVYCIDLLNTCDGWKRIPNYRSAAENPDCIAFKGKIYLFGGPIFDKDGNLLSFTPGEVYDPEKLCWDDLPLPVHENVSWARYVSRAPILDQANNRLIVHFRHFNFLYAYYPDQLRWEPLIPMFAWEPRSVIVDDIIIIFNAPKTDERFNACDLRDRKWRSVSVSVEVPDFNYNLLCWDFEAFIPLNPPGIFCLAVQCRPDDPRDTHLTFLKLRVALSSSRDPLITFYSVINVDIPGSYGIYNYLPIVGREARLHSKALEKRIDLMREISKLWLRRKFPIPRRMLAHTS